MENARELMLGRCFYILGKFKEMWVSFPLIYLVVVYSRKTSNTTVGSQIILFDAYGLRFCCLIFCQATW